MLSQEEKMFAGKISKSIYPPDLGCFLVRFQVNAAIHSS